MKGRLWATSRRWTSSLSIWIQLSGARDCPEVVVEDETISMVTVRVPIDLPADWIADHRQRLRRLVELHPLPESNPVEQQPAPEAA